MYFAEENYQSSLENFREKQMFKSCGPDAKFDKYSELSQYIDYTALLYENKSFTNENVVTSEVDFRVGSYLPTSTSHYTSDSFLGINTVTHDGSM